MRRFLPIFLLFAIVSFQVTRAESPHHLKIGGLARIATIDAEDTAFQPLELDMSYEGNNLDNMLLKSFFVEYSIDRFGFGARGMRYPASASGSLKAESVKLDYLFLFTSFTLFDDLFFNMENDSSIAVLLGIGQNGFHLTSSSRALVTDDWTTNAVNSTGDALLMELNFSSVNSAGWGYILGIYRIDTRHSAYWDSQLIDGGIPFGVYITLLKRIF